MEKTSWERMAEAMLLLYFEPEELQRRTPSERRLLAILQFADLPTPEEPDDPSERRRREALAADLAQALVRPPVTPRRRAASTPARQARGRREGAAPPDDPAPGPDPSTGQS